MFFKITKSYPQHKSFQILLFLLLMLYASVLLAWSFPWDIVRSAPFSGTIVDEETNQPLSDVVVVVSWPQMTSTFAGVHGLGVIEVIEALTDGQGVYRIPGWKKEQRDIGKGGFRDFDPRIYLYKAGYWPQRLNNDIRSEKSFASGETWKSDWDGKTVGLKPMHEEGWQRKDWEKYADYARVLRNARAPGDCGWMVTANMLLAVSRLEQTFVEKLGRDGGPFTYHAGTLISGNYRRHIDNCPVDPYDYFIEHGMSKEEADAYKHVTKEMKKAKIISILPSGSTNVHPSATQGKNPSPKNTVKE